jgi:alanyl-tRNA synthetase
MAEVDLDPDKVRSWAALRAYWRVVRGPCGRCGGPIH